MTDSLRRHPRLARRAQLGRVGRYASVAALTALVAACGSSSSSTARGSGSSGGSGSGSVLAGNPAVVVADSAGKTVAAKNAKVDLTGKVAAGGQNVDLTGTGAIDFANKTFQLTLIVPPAGQVEERFVDSVIYVKVPASSASQFGGKPWLKIDPRSFGSGAGGNPFGSLDSTNPAQILNTLRGAGTVTKVGDEDVRGTPTAHYKADIDINKAAQAQNLDPQQKTQLQRALGGKTSIPEDVWVDDQGLVRRVAIDIDATPNAAAGAAPTSVKTQLKMEFYDYGQATTSVTAPPAGDVTDFSQILGQLGQLGGGTRS